MKVFPESWIICPADTVCSAIIDCLNKTAPVVEQDTGFRMIRTTNVRHGRVNMEDNRFVEEAVFNKWSRRARLKRGDIILSREAPLGEVGLLRSDGKAFLGQRTMLYRADPQKLDQHYLYYQMIGPYVQAVIHGQGQGSTVAHLRVPDAETLPIPVAPLPAQRKIAAVLAAYDDLIEANRRRISLLERMAEEIYREWFVRLRFPGHATTKITKGIPAGWDIRPFSDVVEINPTERIDKEEERPFVAMEELSESSMYFTHHERRKGHVGPKFRNGDVLFPRITPSVENGKRGLVMTLADGEVAQGSTEFIVLREKVLTTEHIYFLSVSEGFRTNAELSMTGASGRQRVQEQCFTQFLVKTPPPALREKFTAIVRPMVSQIRLLSIQTEALTRTRDLLLPRLISGKLPVEALPIAFPPSVMDSAVATPISG